MSATVALQSAASHSLHVALWNWSVGDALSTPGTSVKLCSSLAPRCPIDENSVEKSVARGASAASVARDVPSTRCKCCTRWESAVESAAGSSCTRELAHEAASVWARCTPGPKQLGCASRQCMHLVVPVSLALQHTSQAHPACSPLPFGGVQRGGLTPPVGTETAASDGAAYLDGAAHSVSIGYLRTCLASRHSPTSNVLTYSCLLTRLLYPAHLPPATN